MNIRNIKDLIKDEEPKLVFDECMNDDGKWYRATLQPGDYMSVIKIIDLSDCRAVYLAYDDPADLVIYIGHYE